MQDFILNFIDTVAQKAELPQNRLMSKSASDNLTLLQPRLEYEFLPEKIKRSGRKLAIWRDKDTQTTKKELYTVSQDIKMTLFSENKDFRTAFCRNFLINMPKNNNDAFGNYIKISANNFEMLDPPVKRVGEIVIAITKSYDAILTLNFTYRITTEHSENLIKTIDIKTPIIK